jgi:hypothetical protein
MFALSIFLFYQLPISPWWYWGLFLAPDIGMLGYLINTQTGAMTYNLFHHKGLGVAIWIVGLGMANLELQFIGLLLFGHSSFDRALGYGLKYPDSFKNTHLGVIGIK